MSQNIIKIVVTGGPCGGKSTAMSRITETLSQLGYKVLIVSETATELINNGVIFGDGDLSVLDFQTAISNYQINREKMYEEVAKLVPHEKVIIVCDRGVMDNKAYCTDKYFAMILERLNTNEVKLRDEYNAVFHLKTAADGVESFYTLENNIARRESVEEAVTTDLKTIAAWTGHPYFKIIENNIDFNVKMNNLMAEILKFLGEPVPIQIERKFLIEMPDIKTLIEKFDAVKVDIIQTYLKPDNDNEEKRIRQRGNDGNYVYFLTAKRKVNEISRIKLERRISSDEYLTLLMSADTNLKAIKKERYCFVYNNQYFELDVYPFWNDKAILEIELTEENQSFVIPNFIKVIKEVTNDFKYKNYSLAQNVPI